MRCGPYTRFASGCDERACFGIELWLRDDGPCEASSIVVLHASPRVLIASASLRGVPVRFFIGHAPHRSHPADSIQAWWCQATQLCHSLSNGCPWIFLVDGNCRIGSRSSPAVGDCEADEEDLGGELFHSLLLSLDLWVPSTFSAVMRGTGGTLLQKRSGSLDRSDFIAIPACWGHGTHVSQVVPDITAGHPCVDHFATVLYSVLVLGKSARNLLRARRIDAQAILDPANHARIVSILRAAPTPSWETDVSEHAAVLVDHVYQGLVASFPVAKRPMRTPYFSRDTAALHRIVASLRHSIRTRRATLRLAYLRCVWLTWRQPQVAFTDLFVGTWLWQVQTRLACNCMLLRRYGLLLRTSCKRDKAAHVAALADEVASAPCQAVHKAVHKLIRPRKFRRSTADPLPVLERVDGTLCTSSDEVTSTWREHFRVLEGGVVRQPAQIVLRCRQMQAQGQAPDVLDADRLPTWLSLESAFRRSAPRKAAGPDLLPPSLCRTFSTQMAEAFWPLLLKSMCKVAEPAGLKGGILFHIDKGKPSNRRTCDSHRGILAQSCIAKAFHRSIRRLVVDFWEPRALPLQLGGRAGCSAVFGHLCSRSLLWFARAHQLSMGLVFVDLASAYYAVIRETVLGGGLTDRPISELAGALGLSDEDLQQLKLYVEQEPIMAHEGASAHLTALARELHQQTWFSLAEDSCLIQTERGTRPGGTLADTIFNILFGRVLQRRQQGMQRDFVPRVPWSGCRTPFPDRTAAAFEVCVSDIVYADDLCTPVVVPLAAQLRSAVSSVTADTLNTLSPHALRANLGPTKTAAVVAPIGDGSRQARHEMFTTLKGRVPIWQENQGMLWLDLVPKYRHLGSLVVHDSSLGPEIRHRLALAGASFREAKRKLFACQSIPIVKRASLFRSHVLSVLLVGAGSWPLLPLKDWRAFSGGIMGMYRQLLGLRAQGNWHLTESQLLARVGLPSPVALLHAERLRFLGQLVRSAPDQVWALLSWNDGFRDALKAAGDWFHGIMSGTCPLGDIAADWDSWSSFLISRPGRWKGIIKRAESWDIELHALRATFDSTVRAIWSPLRPVQESEFTGLEHACLPCGMAFRTHRQWGAHAQRVHGYRNSATRLAVGRQCLACLTQYASQRKLKQHLLDSVRCRRHLEQKEHDSFRPPDPPQSEAAHPQAPSIRASQPPAIPPAAPEICYELLQTLQSEALSSDELIYQCVEAHLAPLPVLRRTLTVWAESLPAGPIAAAAADVLLVLRPEHLCSSVGGKASTTTSGPRDLDFIPRIVQPVYRPVLDGCPLCCVGSLDSSWASQWGLAGRESRSVSVEDLPTEASACCGLCVSLPLPPAGAFAFLAPPSMPLRMLRQHIAWVSSLLQALPRLIRTALSGVPVLLRLPVVAGHLEPLSTWLQQFAMTLEAPARNCFTVSLLNS